VSDITTVNVGFFEWDTTVDGKSDTVIGPRDALNVRTRRVGGRTNGILTNFGFGDTVTLNGGTLSILLTAPREITFDPFWGLKATGVMHLNPTESLLPLVKGSPLWNQGTITGTGRFENDLKNQNLLYVGNDQAVGYIEIGGDLSADGKSDMLFDLSGTGAGLFDQVLFEKTVELDGTLTVSLLGDFTPQFGDRFRIIDGVVDGASLTGTFASLKLPAIPGQWQVNYGSDYVELAVIPEPGALVWALAGVCPLLRRRR
jgi:hypothetical protein